MDSFGNVVFLAKNRLFNQKLIYFWYSLESTEAYLVSFTRLADWYLPVIV
jgi:hypothetical protein